MGCTQCWIWPQKKATPATINPASDIKGYYEDLELFILTKKKGERESVFQSYE